MRLVWNWRSAWRWHSVQILAFLAVAPQIWASIPPEIKDRIPAEYQLWVLTALGVLGVLLRVRDQGTES